MAQGKQQPKFERNVPSRLWDNTEDGRMIPRSFSSQTDGKQIMSQLVVFR